jgi:hypothetical protein
MNTIQNYSSLQSTTVINNNIIWLKGYRADEDGGEGYFIGVTNNNTISADGGIVVQGPDANTYWKRINFEYCLPEFWGAYRNGVSNDTTAIQSAIDHSYYSGKACLLSIGNYLVSNTLKIGVDFLSRNVTIKGVCRHRSVIIAQIANNQPVINISNAYYTTLENFTITSNNSTGNCIDLKAPDSVGSFLPQYTKIQKINVNNFTGTGLKINGNTTFCAAGLYTERDLNTVVTDFVAVSCDQGIMAISSQQPTFQNLTLSTNLIGGLTLELGEMARVINSDFVGSCNSQTYTTSTGLNIDNGHLILFSTEKTLISGCKLKNSLGNEISVNYADGTTIRDCIITMDTSNSIGIKNTASNINIESNHFRFASTTQSNSGIVISFASWYGSFGNIVNNYFSCAINATVAEVIKLIGPSSSARACNGNILNNSITTNISTVLDTIILLSSGFTQGVNILNNMSISRGSGSSVRTFLDMSNIIPVNNAGIVVAHNCIRTYENGAYTLSHIIFPSNAFYSDRCKVEHNGVIKQILIADNEAQAVLGNIDGATYGTQDGGFVLSNGTNWKTAKFLTP